MDKNRQVIVVVTISVLLIALYVLLPQKTDNDEIENEIEYQEDQKVYNLTLNVQGVIEKNDRWRFFMKLNFTNTGNEIFNILWMWSNNTRIKYVDGSAEWIGVTGNFTDFPTLAPGESEAFILLLSEYGFMNEPTEIWCDFKIKILERPDIWEYTIHMSVLKGNLIHVST